MNQLKQVPSPLRRKKLSITAAILGAHFLTSVTQASPYGLNEYAADCRRELGEMPPIECLNGAIIPVFDSDHGGAEITNANHRGEAQTCDKPSHLHAEGSGSQGLNNCIPYTRIGLGRAQTGFATSWVWSCRRYFARPINSPIFDDISVIGHNPATGATCFFVSKEVNREAPTRNHDHGMDGTRTPPLDSAAGHRFWRSPAQMNEGVSLFGGGSPRCTQCHDNDPFIHTPYVQQVTSVPGGAPLVPSFVNGPYFALGDPRYFGNDWKIRRLVSPQASTCTSCHSIGSHKTCGSWARMAIGRSEHGHMTTTFKKFHWMPPTGGATWSRRPQEPADTTDRDEVAAVQFINHCCAEPSDRACRWETPTPRAN